MTESDLDNLVESVGKQVREFATRIDEEGITDIAELNAFAKLANTYNRLLESAGQSRVDKKESNDFDLDAMSDLEFLDKYYTGELDDWIDEFASKGFGDPSYPRMLLISDESWQEWERRKPKLVIPERPKLMIPI